MIILRNGNFGKKENLINTIKNKTKSENFQGFSDVIKLYNQYYSKEPEKNKDIQECWNEVVYGGLGGHDPIWVKLMIDIDVKIDDDLNLEIKKFISCLSKKEIKLYRHFQCNNDLFILNHFINCFIDFLIKTLSSNNSCVKTEYFKHLVPMPFRLPDVEEEELENIKLFLKQNISVTKNISLDKNSYHLYFNNIKFQSDSFQTIKNLISKFKDNCKNKNLFVNYVDLLVYKSNSTIRIPFCKKTEDSNNDYHVPLKIEDLNSNIDDLEIKEFLKDGIVVTDVEIPITKENIHKYFMTENNVRFENKIVLSCRNKDDFGIESPDDITLDIKSIDVHETIIPELYIFTPYTILCEIFKKLSVLYESTNAITNIHMFNKEAIFKQGEDRIPIVFDYSKTICPFCEKKSHKSLHNIFFNRRGFFVKKENVYTNCKVKAFYYPEMSDMEIARFIFSKGIFKEVENRYNEIYAFDESTGWVLIQEPSHIKKFIIKYKNEFDNLRRIDKIKDIQVFNEIKTLLKSVPKVKITPFLFKFKNGILNLVTKEFRELKDSKDLIVFNTVNYDYVPKENYNERQKKNHEEILNIINDILPEIIDGERNEDRFIFEQNICTILVDCPNISKPVITFLQGKTLAGKSTLKELVKSAIGDENFLLLPVLLAYNTPINPSVPNPWLAKIAGKRLTFASEPEKNAFYPDANIKFLTEPTYTTRNLYSSDAVHQNSATHFVDTNFLPDINIFDSAVARRVAIVECRTRFRDINENNKLELDDTEFNEKIARKTEIIDNIKKDKYNLVTFNILFDWFINYNLNNLKENEEITLNMRYTPEKFSNCRIYNLIKNLTISGRDIVKTQIKEDRVSAYKYFNIPCKGNNNIKILSIANVEFKKYFEAIAELDKIREYDIDKVVEPLKIFQKDTYVIVVLLKDIKESEFDNVLKASGIKNFDLSIYKKFSELYENMSNIEKDTDENDEDILDF